MCAFGANATFVSYDGKYQTLIEHIIITAESVDTVSRYEILDDDSLNVSRHRLIVSRLVFPTSSMCNKPYSVPRTNWRKATAEHMALYEVQLSNELRNNVQVERASFACEDDINKVYDDIVGAMTKCGDSAIPKSKFRSYLKPYWNRELTNLHKCMKEKRNIWILNGKPRHHEHHAYAEYKNAKRIFRYPHRVAVEAYCDKREGEIDEAAEIDIESSGGW